MSTRYEAYNCGTVSKGYDTARCWSVVENDGTEDGRTVGENMIQADAERVASLLNAAEEED